MQEIVYLLMRLEIELINILNHSASEEDQLKDEGFIVLKDL
jgi:hypothetical protein